MKKIIFTFLILTCSISFGQYGKFIDGEITLKNGSKLIGLVQVDIYYGLFNEDNIIRFKKSEEFEEIKFDHNEAKSVYFKSFKSRPTHFEYVNISTKKRYLLKRLVDDSISIYAFRYSVGSHYGVTATDIKHYIIKDTEKIATLISRNPLTVGLRSMRPFLRNYFRKNCPELSSKLKKMKYFKHNNYRDNFSQIIQDYNSYCK